MSELNAVVRGNLLGTIQFGVANIGQESINVGVASI